MTIDTKNEPALRKITDRSWMEQASCRGVDTERWFDAKPPKRVRRHIREVCSCCPVARLCLSYALVKNEEYGAWGGLAMTELRPLQRRFAAGETLSSVLNVGIPELDSIRSSEVA
jgi:Transcription factor WhiB